jgi:hypothetical protein
MIVSYMTRYKTFRFLGLVVPGSRFLILREVRIIPESEFSVSLDFSAGKD